MRLDNDLSMAVGLKMADGDLFYGNFFTPGKWRLYRRKPSPVLPIFLCVETQKGDT